MVENEKVFLLAPLHIKRREDIAEIFGVSQETVTEWAREGAPIFLVGNKYQADYHALISWLSKNRPVYKNLSSTPLPTV